jgi:hypothetical protein
MIGWIILALVLVIFVTVMLALAGLVSELIRAHDQTDDELARVDDDVNATRIYRRPPGGWLGS